MITMNDRKQVYLPIINEDIEKHNIIQREKRNNKRKSFAFHPSGISHPCSRNIYYQFFRALPKPYKAKKIRIFDVGNDMHNRYNRYAKRAGILIVKELPMKIEEYKLSMRLDQLVLIDNILRLIELKSMNLRKYSMLFGKPEQSHYDQVQLYLWALNEIFTANSKRKIFVEYKNYFPIKRASIVVECKDDQNQEEFPVEYDQKRIDEILSILKDYRENFRGGEIPKRIFEKNSPECRWCDYSEICWSENV